MLLSPIWFILIASVSFALLSWQYYVATRRPLKTIEVVSVCLMLAGLFIGCLWPLLLHIQQGEYAALRTLGIALFAPQLFEFFRVETLVESKSLEQQSSLVRRLLPNGVSQVGYVMTFALMDGTRHLLGEGTAASLVLLVSSAALVSLAAMTSLMVGVQPLQPREKRAQWRVARRMFVARMNLLTVTSGIVYTGLSLGVSGKSAAVITVALFVLNLIVGNFVIMHADKTVLSTESRDKERLGTLAETAVSAKSDVQHSPAQDATVRSPLSTKSSEDQLSLRI